MGGGYYLADLSKTDTIEGLMKKIFEEHGAVDGLVYSAGISPHRPLAQLKPEKLQETFNINYFGFIETVRQVTKRGRYNQGMRIVGISSIASMFGDGAHTGYSGSKAAMDGSMRCMALELADKGICLNTVAPAFVKTKLFEKYLKIYGEDSESYKDLLQREYLGLIDVQDVANLIAFLMSQAARGITGACVPIDSGYTTSSSS